MTRAATPEQEAQQKTPLETNLDEGDDKDDSAETHSTAFGSVVPDITPNTCITRWQGEL